MITTSSLMVYKDQEAIRLLFAALHKGTHELTDNNNFKIAYTKLLIKINSL